MVNGDYARFLEAKRMRPIQTGFEISDTDINSNLFPFQRDIVRFALRRGKSACFAHTGLGKGPIQMEWCQHLIERGPVLILAPLDAVPIGRLPLHERASDDDDSKHIAPLQLTVIRRAIELWTNPGDIVFSAFAGIGSEGYVALQEGRRFVGAELKDTYYRQCCRNCDAAIESRTHGMLFAEGGAD